MVWKDIAKFIRPMAVPAFPFRCLNNLGAAIGHVHIDALQAIYTRLYGLTLQQKGWGPELTTVESSPGTCQLSISLKNTVRE